MNLIFIDSKRKRIYCRPDSTVAGESRTYYRPPFVKTMTASPFICARMEKSGKCIQSRFASRYYTRTGKGIVLHGYGSDACSPDNGKEPVTGQEIRQAQDAWMKANMLDGSTFIGPLAETQLTEEESAAIAEAVEKATAIMSVKTGDLICIIDGEEMPCGEGDAFGMAGMQITIK